MIARFFIDRPIFATVLSVVITLIGGIALFYLPVAQYPRITPTSRAATIASRTLSRLSGSGTRGCFLFFFGRVAMPLTLSFRAPCDTCLIGIRRLSFAVIAFLVG